MRILIVDDDYVCRVKLKKHVSEYGDCDAVPGAEIAKEMIRASDKESLYYDLFILDVNMPETRGPELVQWIRSFEQDRGHLAPAKILMVTSEENSKELMASFREGGATLFLLKPFTMEKVKGIMQKLLA